MHCLSDCLHRSRSRRSDDLDTDNVVVWSASRRRLSLLQATIGKSPALEYVPKMRGRKDTLQCSETYLQRM